MTKKILITGASGLIGSTLTKTASKNYDLQLVSNQTKLSLDNVSVSYIDLIKDRTSIIDLIKEYKPNFVVHTVAYPSVDFCETNSHLADILHVEVTSDIADVCNDIGSKIIYFSTDAVFDGKTSKKYTESDLPNPINYYGKTKLKAEKILLEYNTNIILRTTVVYGWNVKSRFTNWVLGKLKNLETVGAFIDQFNTPTLVDDISEIILKFFESDKVGLYNVVGSSCISRYEFALKLAEKFHLDKNLIKPIPSKQKNQVAPRPENGCLDNSKLENELNFTFSDIDTGIETIYEQSKIRKL